MPTASQQVRPGCDAADGERPLARFGIGLAALLAMVGLAASGVLLQHHVVLQVGGDPLLKQVCEAAATTSCDDVIASGWGKFEWVRGGRRVVIPTAMLGWVFFSFLTAWFLVVGRPAGDRRWMQWLPACATGGGVVYCAFFAAVMFGLLDKWCPLCAVTHAATLLLFILTLLLWPRRPDEDAETAPARPTAGTLLAGVLLAVALSAAGASEYGRRLSSAYAQAYYQRWQDYEKDVRLNVERFLKAPPREVPILPDDPVRGDPNAAHTVVLFSDFQCPHCRLLAGHMEERLKENPGGFRLVFKHFPMDTSCNPGISRTLHAGACAAAVAADVVLSVAGNEAFWTMHDELFEEQKKLSAERLFELAEKLGVTRDTMREYIGRRSTWDRIHAHVEQARALGIRETPTMFFDGRQMSGWGDRHFWRYLLSDEGRELILAAERQASASQPESASRPESTSPPAGDLPPRPASGPAPSPAPEPPAAPASEPAG